MRPLPNRLVGNTGMIQHISNGNPNRTGRRRNVFEGMPQIRILNSSFPPAIGGDVEDQDQDDEPFEYRRSGGLALDSDSDSDASSLEILSPPNGYRDEIPTIATFTRRPRSPIQNQDPSTGSTSATTRRTRADITASTGLGLGRNSTLNSDLSTRASEMQSRQDALTQSLDNRRRNRLLDTIERERVLGREGERESFESNQNDNEGSSSTFSTRGRMEEDHNLDNRVTSLLDSVREERLNLRERLNQHRNRLREHRERSSLELLTTNREPLTGSISDTSNNVASIQPQDPTRSTSSNPPTSTGNFSRFETFGRLRHEQEQQERERPNRAGNSSNSLSTNGTLRSSNSHSSITARPPLMFIPRAPGSIFGRDSSGLGTNANARHSENRLRRTFTPVGSFAGRMRARNGSFPSSTSIPTTANVNANASSSSSGSTNQTGSGNGITSTSSSSQSIVHDSNLNCEDEEEEEEIDELEGEELDDDGLGRMINEEEGRRNQRDFMALTARTRAREVGITNASELRLRFINGDGDEVDELDPPTSSSGANQQEGNRNQLEGEVQGTRDDGNDMNEGEIEESFERHSSLRRALRRGN